MIIRTGYGSKRIKLIISLILRIIAPSKWMQASVLRSSLMKGKAYKPDPQYARNRYF